MSDAGLDLVVQLNKTQLKEFVYSPSKIRLRLLKKWSEERSIVDSTVDSVKNVSLGLSSMVDNATEKIRKDTNRIEKRIQELEEKKKNKKPFWRR